MNLAYLHSCHSMRVSNLFDTEALKDLVGEIRGENLEARDQGFFIREEDEEGEEYLELGLATEFLQWSFRLENTVATALEFVREKIAVADIFVSWSSSFSVWFMFYRREKWKECGVWSMKGGEVVCFLFSLCHVYSFDRLNLVSSFSFFKKIKWADKKQ